jgi:hypothetical protein
VSLSRSPRFKTGSRQGEKRAEEYITHEYLDRVLADFSGYIAADELYDGPYCVLSIVDNHRFKRLVYEVLDHDPTAKDITQFFQRFREALQARGLSLRGITTDGSALYPESIRQVFGSVPHQICEFHVLAELNKAVLHAVAQARRDLKATLPKIGRGRPSPGDPQETDRIQDRRSVRASSPLCPTPPEPRRAEDSAADHPGSASPANPAADHGASLSAL